MVGEEGRCIPGKGNRMYKGRRPRVRKSKMISHTGLEWGQLRLGHHNSLALEEALTQLLWVVCVLGMAKEGRKMGGENRKGQQHLSTAGRERQQKASEHRLQHERKAGFASSICLETQNTTTPTTLSDRHQEAFRQERVQRHVT